MTTEQMQPAQGRQVLVVEEQMMPMLLAEDVLLAEGYRVATAASFHGATRAMTTCEVEAVVLDLHLADRSSLLLADEFIELGIPMLFASTRTHAELPERFRHAQVLRKPYLPTELVAGVSRLLRRDRTYPPAAQEGLRMVRNRSVESRNVLENEDRDASSTESQPTAKPASEKVVTTLPIEP